MRKTNYLSALGRSVTTIAFAVWAPGCFLVDTYQRTKQVRTFTDMQVIVARIEEFQRSGGRGDDPKLAEYLNSEAGGRDQWGHPFLFRSKPEGEGFSYVLVSVGRDGKLDTASLTDYFNAPETRIYGLVSKDIVFRDGTAVTKAGK